MTTLDRRSSDDIPYAVLGLLGVLAIVIAATILVIASGITPPRPTLMIALGVPLVWIVSLLSRRGHHRTR